MDIEHEKQRYLFYHSLPKMYIYIPQAPSDVSGPDIDPMTGLEIRWHFLQYVEQALQDANACQSQVGMIILNVDCFQQFNNDYHHSVADQLLRVLALAFREVVRGEGMLARWGGDEFAVAIPNATSEEIERLAFDLRVAGGQVTVDADGIVAGPITLAAGMVISPNHGATYAELMEAASAAIDQRYQLGRDRAVWPLL